MYGNLRGVLRRLESARAPLAGLLLAAAAAGTLGAGAGTGSYSGLLSLPGHVHRLAQPRFDAGEAPNSIHLGGLDLVFAKSPEQEQALTQLLADQQNPQSPQYHQWLSPAEYGRRFGPSDATLAAVSNWLRSNGLQVGTAPPARGHLPFSGSKSAVEGALHTQVHLFDLAGARHYANVSDPMVPAELKPFVAAIRGLNDFRPRPGVRASGGARRGVLPTVGRAPGTAAAPDTFYSGTDQYPGYIGPTDFAIMYNVQPVYQQGITGAGVTVAIAAQSDLEPSVLTEFWTGFGVSGPSFGVSAQQFSSIPVPGGTDPGQTKDGNEDEAFLDTEIVGALAPGATLLLVRDADAGLAAQYVIDQNLAAILNISFSQCESDQASSNSVTSSMFQQAAGEGITVTVSSDDAGVAGCTAAADLGTQGDVNSNGFAVNGIASTPYDLAVGGTDFDPNTEQQYWSGSNQTGTLASATSHIPEIVWNDSCANPVFATLYIGSDPITFCNTAELQSNSGSKVSNPFIEISGSGGGLSSCTTTGNGGACAGGYPQPSWQAGVTGIGSFGARALPDVSMIATRWLMCSYDTTPCDPTQAPTFPPAATGTIKVLEGTSAAAPSVAAIIALVDQTQISSAEKDGRQGLVNPVLYKLAAPEYSPGSAAACDASQGAITSPACVFYDVTSGSSAQPCSVANYATNAAGSMPASTCGSSSGDANGVMEVNGTQSYAAGNGFDLATGLGSINAGALIAAVQGSSAPSGLAATASGQTVTLTWTADSNATSGYDIYQGTAPGTVSSTPVQQNVTGTSATVTGLQFAQTYVFAIAAVSSSGVSPRSAPVEVTIVPAAPTGLKVTGSSAGSLTLAWTASSGAGTYNVFDATTSGAEGTTPILTGVSGTTSTIAGLTPAQQYFFTVVALDTGGASAPSAEASGTVVPAAPTGLSATAGNASVSLSWSASSGATSYEIFQGSASGGEGTQAVKTGISGTSASIGNLSNGTLYYFTVAAVDAGGASAASNETHATPVAPKGGGGGALDWLSLGLLAALASFRRSPSSRPRAARRHCR